MRTIFIYHHSRRKQPWRWHMKSGGHITTGGTELYKNRKDMERTIENSLGGLIRGRGQRYLYRTGPDGPERIKIVMVEL